ncbi:hypothetical protein [Kitasatospora terrestris]|uniref:Lipoprotein n=1 Tax=Kitasatospora terrestris TaxID=258051 RepID=A0ABP9DL72_9ACTN
MTSRIVLAAAVAVAALTLTACDPDEIPATDAAPTASTAAPAPASASASAATKPSGSAKPSPAGHRTVAETRTAGGLTLATGQGTLTDVPVDPGEMREGMHFVQSEYNRPGQPATARKILVLAVDNVPEDPNKRREHLWRGLIDYALGNGSSGTPTTAEPYQAGPLGGSLECLSLPAKSGPTDVICGWADASTAGVALLPGTTPAEAGRLFAAIRADVEH